MNVLLTTLAATTGQYSEYINPDGYKIDIDLAHMMKFGLEIAALGLTIVFAVLIIIWLLVELMGYVFYKLPQKRAARATAVEKPKMEDFIALPKQPAELLQQEEEIALITAAVAAYIGKPASGFVVRSVRRTAARSGK